MPAHIVLPSARYPNWSFMDGKSEHRVEVPNLTELRMASYPRSAVMLPPEFVQDGVGWLPFGYEYDATSGEVWRTETPTEWGETLNPFGVTWTGALQLHLYEEDGEVVVRGQQPPLNVSVVVHLRGRQVAFNYARPIPVKEGEPLFQTLREWMPPNTYPYIDRAHAPFLRKDTTGRLLEQMRCPPEPLYGRADKEPTKGRELVLGTPDTYEFPADLFERPDHVSPIRARLLRLGVRDDLSGYAVFDPRWDKLEDQSYRINAWEPDDIMPWSRVYIHCDATCWRFLFVLEGRCPMSTSNLVPWTPCVHLFPVIVEHDETRPVTKAWRGLPFPVQQTINNVPGMSSAMAHALNTLKGRVTPIRERLSMWRGPTDFKRHHILFLNGPWRVSLHGRGYRGKVSNFPATFDLIVEQLGPNRLVPSGSVQPVARKTETKRVIEL